MTQVPENLLFGMVQNGGDISVTETLLSFGVFDAQDVVQPLFPQNVVGKPIPVMTEGKFYVRQGEKYREVHFGPEDIKRLASKQPRDVPFNYDHRRVSGEEGVKGWLRFGRDSTSGTELSYVGHVTGPDGQQLTALFATPELSQEAQSMIAKGIYRDVSVEYRSMDDVLTGCALTSYPVMRNLQFSELEGQDPEPTTNPPLEEEEDMDITKLSKEAKAELFNDMLVAAGIENGITGLVNMGEELKTFREQASAPAKPSKEAALAAAETEINALIGSDHFGLTDEIATQAQEVLAWASTNADLKFGEDDTPDVSGAVKGLLGVIGKQAKQITLLGGAVPATADDGTQQFGDVDPVVPDPDFDESRTSEIAGIAKRFLGVK